MSTAEEKGEIMKKRKLIIAIMIAAITVTTSLNPPPLNLTGPPPGYDPPGYDPPDEEWLELWN